MSDRRPAAGFGESPRRNGIPRAWPHVPTVTLGAVLALGGCSTAQIPPHAAPLVRPPHDSAVEALLRPWNGPDGGLPPLDQATPQSIEAAYHAAIASKQAEVRTIAGNPAPPTFDNTIAALEDSGRTLQRVDAVLHVYSTTMNTGDMPETAKRLAPLLPQLEIGRAHV